MTTILMDSSILGHHFIARSLSAEIVSRLSALHAELAEMARSLDALESGLGEVDDAIDDRLDCGGAKGLGAADNGVWKPVGLHRNVGFD